MIQLETSTVGSRFQEIMDLSFHKWKKTLVPGVRVNQTGFQLDTVFFIVKNIFIMKNVTDFCKMVETGVDPRLQRTAKSSGSCQSCSNDGNLPGSHELYSAGIWSLSYNQSWFEDIYHRERQNWRSVQRFTNPHFWQCQQDLIDGEVPRNCPNVSLLGTAFGWSDFFVVLCGTSISDNKNQVHFKHDSFSSYMAQLGSLKSKSSTSN